MAPKLGRQTPTKSFVLDYDRSLAQQAIDIYEKSGQTAMEWQKKLLRDMMAVQTDGLWVHTKCGYSISRRNGKTESVYMRELWGLEKGEQIAHTAHKISTAHSSFEKTCRLLVKAGYSEGKDFTSVRAKGAEKIEMVETGGRIQYRTRTGSGGLGEGFDLLIIDEAQEYTDDQRSALVYTVSDSPNPQTIFCGTPPTNVSKGTVFPKFRKNCLAGREKNAFWAEWSVDQQSDIHDVSLWYETNPSMGIILTERKVEDEIGTDEVDFNVQRLGLWLEYSQQSAISKVAWESCQTEVLPDLTGKLFAAVKFSKDGKNVVLSIAVRTKDDRIFVECLDCRDQRGGTTWLMNFLQSADIAKVIVDGAAGQPKMIQDMKDYGLKKPVLPKVNEIIDANAQFELGVFQRDLVHCGQVSLAQIVSNSEHRAIGTNGGFGYVSLNPAMDVTLMEATALAYWACKTSKTKSRQRISY